MKNLCTQCGNYVKYGYLKETKRCQIRSDCHMDVAIVDRSYDRQYRFLYTYFLQPVGSTSVPTKKMKVNMYISKRQHSTLKSVASLLKGRLI